jgi:sulfur relay (sulfurtransferase) complex TusBCD TusD component (DsrE family)
MKIGFLLHKSPEHQDAHTVKRLAEAFAEAGHEVSIFLMEDGVLNVIINHSPRGLSAGYDPLLAKGVRIALCTYTTEIRGLSRDQFLKGVEFQSQYDLSKLVNGCDRFLSFI